MTRSFKDQEDPEPKTRQPGWQSKLDKLTSFGRYSSDDDLAVEPVKIDPGKRLVSLIIDSGVAYGLGIAVSFIPLMKEILGTHLIFIFYLVIRDALFQGRGVGKNLMGLQVVDLKTGRPANLITSVKRNIVIFGPTLLVSVVSTVLRVIPTGVVDQYVPGFSTLVNQSAFTVIQVIGTVYTLIVIPYEIYRAYTRDDGMRWGDQFAGTTIVEAPMDFSRLV